MALQLVSDKSGDPITDETHAAVIVGGKRLDLLVSEADTLASQALDLVTLEIHTPNARRPRVVVMEAKTLGKWFGPKVDLESLLAAAPSASGGTKERREPRGSKSGPDVSKYGQLKRGRVSDAEKAWVRANRDEASANRQAQGHPAIDWDDAKEKERYGL